MSPPLEFVFFQAATIASIFLSKIDWYFMLLALVASPLVSLNELGYGAVALLPGLLLADWLMTKALEIEKPGE